MDRRIELRHRVLASPNSVGEKIASYPTAYATVWARKNDTRGSKRLLAQQVVAEQLTEFHIRHRTDVLVTDRLVSLDNNAVYEIQQIAEVGRRDELDLLCRAIVS